MSFDSSSVSPTPAHSRLLYNFNCFLCLSVINVVIKWRSFVRFFNFLICYCFCLKICYYCIVTKYLIASSYGFWKNSGADVVTVDTSRHHERLRQWKAVTVPRDSLSAYLRTLRSLPYSSSPAATMDVGRALRLWVVPALMYSILYSISVFYGTLFLIRFLYRWVRAPSELFWRVSRRPVPPACLSDPALGTHAYVQLKV